MEQTLPFDEARCIPDMAHLPYPRCQNCMRFSDHPWQTFNPHGQWTFGGVNPADCTQQIPVSEGGVK